MWTLSLTRIVRSNTSVPIPRVLDWSDDPSNPVGSEYVIMEHAPGIQLQQAWHKMDGPQRIQFIRSISTLMRSMTQLEFPAYGSIYFARSPILNRAQKVPLDQPFCIGPHCAPRYWDCTVGERRYYHLIKPNRGPCKTRSLEYTMYQLTANRGRHTVILLRPHRLWTISSPS